MKIPQFLDIAVIEKRGEEYFWTAEWRDIIKQLMSELSTDASDEGLVMPTQNATNITTIQNNTLSNGAATCQFGTGLYNSTANSIMFCINDGSGNPIFKTVTLT